MYYCVDWNKKYYFVISKFMKIICSAVETQPVKRLCKKKIELLGVTTNSMHSRNYSSSVGVVTRLWDGRPRYLLSNPRRRNDFPLLQSVELWRANRSLVLCKYGFIYSTAKLPVCEANHSPFSSDKS